MIEIFANKSLNFTIFESLPKEKTIVIGTTDICLYHYYLKYYTQEDLEAPIPECQLTFQKILPIAFASGAKPGVGQDASTLSVEISLSRALISPTDLQNGMFATLKVEEIYPVPDDWSLRDGNEKDLNSSSHTY